MVLFDEKVTVTPPPRKPLGRATLAGIWALVIALVVLLVLTFLPTAYVIQQPGPVYNTLGTAQNADGEDVALITVDGAETYPTDGSLDLLTVQVVGNPQRTPSWLELAGAWFDRTRAVLPLESVFPAGQTTEQRRDQSTAMMVNSQQDATAAALTEAGFDVPSDIVVYEFSEDSASQGILEVDDVILAANDTPIDGVDDLREVINDGDGEPVELTILRDGVEERVSVTPTEQTEADGTTTWVIGVILATDFEFPIDVQIQLNNVGGPSAGMMFALGIVDLLTPGDLTGGEDVAGTGTITSDGIVGPIGGIRQKMWGAVGAGAEWFLAPQANCDEVVGHVPDGLRVFAIEDLDDALTAVETVADGGDLDALPACTATTSSAVG
ncbi:S16 family serine protease [Microbacterium sp. ET2]|uniref:YlbL family protein n=1 Tax=Microbacterium albipurpureum TaxID=3050384 RepID=UPI00259CBC75|nr:S16 family serine protease [Microbacterium sp. ET2 (Ac-2212)]WJL95921.1 S16 family serine protease [Microbacterium sp. ET2 (Ac-2212)]